jgi:hypothetical protein
LIDLARAEAAQARAELAAAYEAQQASIQSRADAALASIDETRQQKMQAVGDIADSERERLRAAHETERQGAIDFVAGARSAIVAAGEEQAERANAESEARATAILAEAQGVPVGGDPPVVEAQQKAAQQIAERAASQCRTTGADLQDRLRGDAADYAASDYETGLQDYLSQLDQQVADALGAVDEFVSQAQAQVDSVAAQATEGVRKIAGESSAALDAAREAAETRIAAWEAQVPDAIQSAADQIADSFRGQLAPFAEALLDYGASGASQVRRMAGAESGIEEAAALVRENLHAGYDAAMNDMSGWQSRAVQDLGSSVFDPLREQLAALVSDQRAAVDDVGGKLGDGLEQVAQSAASDMEEAATSFQAHLSASIGEAIEQMTSGGADLRAKWQENQLAAAAALARVVDDALVSEDNLLADARSEMASAASQIAAKYQELQAEAQRRNDAETSAPATRVHRGIWSSITSWWSDFTDTVKAWFADTFGDFWGGLLFGILETLVVVVVGALAIFAVAAGISALLALAGIAVAAAKIALIIGVVLLVIVVIPLLIYNRVQEYHKDNPGKEIGVWTGIGLGLLGILDVTGIPFIIEAAVGKRATGGELHGWDRGFRLGQGIVMLATAIFSAYKFFSRGTPTARPGGGGGSTPIDPNAPPVDPNAPPQVDPNAPPQVDPNAPPQVDPNAPPQVDPNAPPQVDPNKPPQVDPNAPQVDPNKPPEVDPNKPSAAGRSPEQLGDEIGAEVKGQQFGKRATIARRVTEAGLSQDDAVTATRSASKVFGRVAPTETLPDGSKVVPSVQAAPPPGAANQPIFVVRPDGSVFPARATLTVVMEPKPHVEITNIVPG